MELTAWIVLICLLECCNGLTLGVIGNQDVRIEEGSHNVSLRCPVQGAVQPVRYNWTFNGNAFSPLVEPLSTNFHKAADSIILKTALKSMHGQIGAVVTDGSGASVVCTFHVQILYGPLFTSSPQKLVVAQAGDNVTLSCTVDGYPPPVIHWIKDARQLGYLNNVVMENGTLNFGSISVYDIGFYQCNATNSHSSIVSSMSSIKVSVPLSIANVPNNPVSLTRGSNHQLTCNFTGFPRPIVSWYKSNTLLTNGGQFTIQTGNSKQNTWTVLIFKGVKMINAGAYRCTAVQEQFTPLSYTFQVIIAIAPEIVSVHVREKSINVGLPVILNCKASGTPAPEYTWFLNQLEIIVDSHYQRGTDGNLVIRRTLPNDEGTYFCRAHNVAGTANSATTNLIVEGLKFSKVPPRQVNILVGESTDIPCQVQGNTNVIRLGWYKDNHKILHCDEKYLSGTIIKIHSVDRTCSVSADHGNLYLRNLRSIDSGNYTCRISELGLPIKLEAVTFVNVLEPVVFIKTPPTFLEEDNHGTLTLECQAKGTPPPDIIWLKDGKQIFNSGRHRIESGKITIMHLHASDSATYSCFASNYKSQGTRECRIRVRTPPGILNVTIDAGHMVASVLWQLDDNGGYPITSVSLEYRVVDEGGWRIMKDVSTAMKHTYKITHLEPFSKYELNIWASNRLGNGIISTHNFMTLRESITSNYHYNNSAKGFIVLGTILCVVFVLMVTGFFYFHQRKRKSCFVRSGATTLREDTHILVKHQHSLQHEARQRANPAFDPSTVSNETLELSDVKQCESRIHSNLKENKKAKNCSFRKEKKKKKLEVTGIDNIIDETVLQETAVDGESPNKKNVHFKSQMNENNCNNNSSSDDDYWLLTDENLSSSDETDEYSSSSDGCVPLSDEYSLTDDGSSGSEAPYLTFA